MTLQDRLLASGRVPDMLLRRVIRSRVRRVQRSFDRIPHEAEKKRQDQLAAQLESGPIAIHAEAANRQHYELPAEFFRQVLGPRLKYSCCYWETDGAGLDAAEEAMLELTARRAGLEDGQDILDLGCGWGSMALWTAERYPHSLVTAVSNSHGQGRFILQQARLRGLQNLTVVTADVAEFRPTKQFDRVVSVEMFEHVRNHKALMRRIADWLKPDGALFVHVFCHRRHLYAFEPGKRAWMERYFFTGGIMPSWDYLPDHQDALALRDRWEVDGHHYALTLRAWLQSLDKRREQVMPLLEEVYGTDRAWLWLARWRIFFMACEETFALDEGRSYFVGHYVFSMLDSARGRR